MATQMHFVKRVNDMDTVTKNDATFIFFLLFHKFDKNPDCFVLVGSVFAFLFAAARGHSGVIPSLRRSRTAHKEASVSSAACHPPLLPPPGNDLGLLFFKRRSISSLFKTPLGEETSVFAAISGEHVGDSAGLTVADKSGVINTHTRTRAACKHTRLSTISHTRAHTLAAAGGGSLLLGEQQMSG